jgi:two-component system, LytTR family, response regulator
MDMSYAEDERGCSSWNAGPSHPAIHDGGIDHTGRIRALIIDCDADSRRQLLALLQCEPDFAVVGECATVEEVAHALRVAQPQVLFVAAQLAQCLESPARAAAASMACVLLSRRSSFSTSRLQLNVLDCLSRPFGIARFLSALNQVRHWLSTREAGSAATACADSILIRNRTRIVCLRLEELEILQADGNYVDLQAGAAKYRVRERMHTLQSLLPAGFVRIHRSFIVNLAMMKEFYPIGGGEYMIALHCGRQLPVGATYPDAVRAAIADWQLPKVGWRTDVQLRSAPAARSRCARSANRSSR